MQIKATGCFPFGLVIGRSAPEHLGQDTPDFGRINPPKKGLIGIVFPSNIHVVDILYRLADFVAHGVEGFDDDFASTLTLLDLVRAELQSCYGGF